MKRLMIGIILTLVFAITGCFIRYTLILLDREPGNDWTSLGSPPGGATHLLAANSSTIYVQSSNGKNYSCYYESKYDHSCWNAVDVIPKDPLGPSTPYSLQPPIPSAPKELRESLVIRYDMDTPVYEGYHTFAYVLLKDGTVNQWISETIFLA